MNGIGHKIISIWNTHSCVLLPITVTIYTAQLMATSGSSLCVLVVALCDRVTKRPWECVSVRATHPLYCVVCLSVSIFALCWPLTTTKLVCLFVVIIIELSITEYSFFLLSLKYTTLNSILEMESLVDRTVLLNSLFTCRCTRAAALYCSQMDTYTR